MTTWGERKEKVKPLGWVDCSKNDILRETESVREAFGEIDSPLFLTRFDESFGVIPGFRPLLGSVASLKGVPIFGMVPPFSIDQLGDSRFCKDYGIEYPLLGGSMAHQISSVEIVEALGKNGMLAFLGTAGLSPEQVENAIGVLKHKMGNFPYGFNLIHSPNEPRLEEAIVDLYLREKIRLIEASAYLTMTLPLVKFRVCGIHRDADGNVVAPNRIIAKVSRVEVATKFFSPPPSAILKELVNSGFINSRQAEMASSIPVAQDVTAEADSGGHTDNRPAITLVPTILALRDRMQKQFNYRVPLRVGAAGGIATPQSLAAAFAMGAAYVMTGSVNQSCIESGLSTAGKEMLSQAQQADVTMAPAGDMFEMGVTVQVLKRGTMFPMRAAKLYELYKEYKSIEEIPEKERIMLEQSVFKAPLTEIWEQTKAFFRKRDPSQIERAEKDPKHLMALVFRWYLGQSPRWAVSGDVSRKIDFQIWCGPAMGAFNEWVKGTFLEPLENRKIVVVLLNLLYGGAVVNRLNSARNQGFPVAPELFSIKPQPEEKIRKYLKGNRQP